MKNFSIIALRSSMDMSNSPLFSFSGKASVKDCQFSKHFTTIIRQSYSLNLKASKFSKILNTAIAIDSTSKSSTLYQSTQTFSGDKEYTITDCLFYECKSSSTGGAINIKDGADSYSLLIRRTGFKSCKADSCGAVSSVGKTTSIQRCCFEGNSAQKYSAFKAEGNIVECTDSSFGANKGSYTAHITPTTGTFKASNLTQNTAESNNIIYINGKSADSVLLFFKSNDAESIIYIEGKETSQQYLNFQTNVGSCSIEFGSSLTLHDSAFVHERTRTLAKKNGNSVNMMRISYSGTEAEFKELTDGIFCIDLKANTTSLTSSSINSQAECWILLPGGSNINFGGLSTTTKLLLVFAAICVAAVAFILGRRFCCSRRYGLSNDKLAYTL